MITNKKDNFISVIAYVHNNENLLPCFLSYVIRQLNEYFKNYEIILVNDHCKSDISQVVKKAIHECCIDIKHINIVNMSHYQGIEASMNAGDDFAIGDFIYEFDSLYIDYDENLMIQLYHKLVDGYDIVSAVPKHNVKLTSRLFYCLYNISQQKDERLNSETFRIISRRAWNRIKALSTSIPYRKALYKNCGLKHSEIYYDNGARSRYPKYLAEEKTSRLTTALDSLIIFTNVMERVSLIISLAFLGFTICVGIYTVCMYFRADKPVEGWAPLMGVLSLSFFGIFFLLTAILKYLSVIIKLIFKQQNYLVESTEKITYEQE